MDGCVYICVGILFLHVIIYIYVWASCFLVAPIARAARRHFAPYVLPAALPAL
jgi:hypothetical protein